MKTRIVMFLLVFAGCAGGPAEGSWVDDSATLDPLDESGAFESTFVTLALEVGDEADAWPLSPCGEISAEARTDDPNAFTLDDVSCTFEGGRLFTAPKLEVLFVATDPIERTGALQIGGEGEVIVGGGAPAPALLQGSLEREPESE